jgi:hypothetical protein
MKSKINKLFSNLKSSNHPNKLTMVSTDIRHDQPRRYQSYLNVINDSQNRLDYVMWC